MGLTHKGHDLKSKTGVTSCKRHHLLLMSILLANQWMYLLGSLWTCSFVDLLCSKALGIYIVTGPFPLRYYLSRSLSLSIIQSHKHYNANNMHQRYSIHFCCINKISNSLNLPIPNLNDKKTRNYKILVALATRVLNREYVITNYTHAIENSLMQHLCCSKKFSNYPKQVRPM